MNKIPFSITILTLLCATHSFAAPIIFTHTGTGSGTIGSIPFANAEFTITNVGDTAHRASGFGLFYIDAISASNCVAAEVGCHFPPPPLLAPIRNVSRSHRCFILFGVSLSAKDCRPHEHILGVRNQNVRIATSVFFQIQRGLQCDLG